jgi:phosphatidylglycerophosphate synthase
MMILFIGGSIIAAQKGKVRLPPDMIGKICTSLQMLFIGSVFMTGLAVSSIPTSSIQNILMVSSLYVVALTTIVSGISYAKVAFNALRKS